MALWRGAGGPGDATGDSANQAQLAQQYAENAANSASAAAGSASDASDSADAANSSETAAAASASAAASSASSASSSASAASSSASAAASSASAAASSETAAAASESAAASSASASSTSATNAANSATNAASSASAAGTSATNAAASASAAAASESAAATSETNAAASEAAAATSETNAAASEAAAATSETNAAASESAAATSESNAASSASAAASSASSASTSATNAANSASAASTSASNAATSETNAAASASAASSSASEAATYAANAAASYDSFDDRYLGSKTSDPSVDNDGNALVTGALYYNSTDGVMKIWDGGQWIAASAASQAILSVYKYTATSGQTTFSGADDNAVTLGYTAGSILVTVNGVLLEDGTDYTATDGTSVVLSVAAALNDEVNIHAFSTFDLASLTLNNPSINGNVSTTGINFDSDTLVIDATNNRTLIGTNTSRGIGSSNASRFEIEGTSTGGSSNISLTSNRNDSASASLIFGKTRATSIGGNTIVNSGDSLGNILFAGADGVDTQAVGASISAQVDGTPGVGDMPGRLVFSTTADGAETATERMRIDSAGNVGIGTSSPNRLLDIATTTAAGSTLVSLTSATDGNCQLLFGDTASDTQGKVLYNNSGDYMAFHANGYEAMRINNSNYVGIGTSSPSANLHVQGNSAVIKLLESGGSEMRMAVTGSASYLGTYVDDPLVFTTNSTERMRITSSGNVGIGTTSPAQLLSLSSTSPRIILTHTTASSNAYVDAATSGVLEFSADDNNVAASSSMRFKVDGTERMRIDSSGNLLVGTTSQIFGADFKVNLSGTRPLAIKNTSTTAGDNSEVVWHVGTTGDNRFIEFGTESSYTQRGSITYNRGAGLTAYNTTSDYRLKENIVDLPNALATISQLRPRQFDWKETGNTTTGFIAHELAEVLPHAVSGEKDAVDADGNPVYQGVDTSFLVATLTAAIQEQQAIIEQLKADVAALKGN